MKIGGPKRIHCPVEITLEVLGGKWKTVILWYLSKGTRRFLELQRLIPGITRKMLTQQLRDLERAGAVKRKVYDQVPPKVEYALSTHGRTLRPVLHELCKWGLKQRAKAARKAKV